MTTITRQRFADADAADYRRDPVLWEAVQKAEEAEERRYQNWLCDQRSFAFSGHRDPNPYRRSTTAELVAECRRVIARGKAFDASPEGKIRAQLRQIEDMNLGFEVQAIIDRIREACCRSFDNEQKYITTLCAQLVGIATTFRTAAMKTIEALPMPPKE